MLQHTLHVHVCYTVVYIKKLNFLIPLYLHILTSIILVGLQEGHARFSVAMSKAKVLSKLSSASEKYTLNKGCNLGAWRYLKGIKAKGTKVPKI